MSVLWSIGSGSVRHVIANLEEGRNLAYTSAATILENSIEQKKFVESTKKEKPLFMNLC